MISLSLVADQRDESITHQAQAWQQGAIIHTENPGRNGANLLCLYNLLEVNQRAAGLACLPATRVLGLEFEGAAFLLQYLVVLSRVGGRGQVWRIVNAAETMLLRV